MKENYLDKITFIFSLIAFLLCFSLFIFITYRSEIYWNGTERNYYFKYIYISLFLTMFWSFVFFLEYRKKAYVILYFSCFVLAFYLFEGYLSFSKSYSNLLKKQIAMYESENNKIFDKRTKYQVLKDSTNILKRL